MECGTLLTLTVLALRSHLQDLRERNDFDISESTRVGFVELIFKVDDGANFRDGLHNVAQFREAIVRCDDVADVGLVDPVSDSVFAECRIDCDEGAALLEQPVGRDHPFGTRLSEHDDFVARHNAELAHSLSEVRGLQLGFDERAPLVLAQSILLEDSSVLLTFVFLSKNLPGAEALLVLVVFHHILEHLLERVDIVLKHVDVMLLRRIDIPVSDLRIVRTDYARL